MWKKTIVGVVILILLAGGYYYMNTIFVDQDYNALNMIRSRIDGRNRLIDYDNEIGVESIEDIGFKVKDNKIYLTYGKVQFELGDKELLDKDFLTGLKQIGIEIKRNSKGEYILYYWGEKVQKWAN